MTDGPPIPEIPDINGTFLLAIKVAGTGNAAPLQAIVTSTMTKTGETATLDLHTVYLTAADRTPIASPTFDLNGVNVSNAGEFNGNVGDLTVPMAANPLGFEAVAQNVHLVGTIKTTDLFCGTLTGDITSPTPLPLAGSTFGAIRVMAGQSGDQLPQPTIKCP